MRSPARRYCTRADGRAADIRRRGLTQCRGVPAQPPPAAGVARAAGHDRDHGRGPGRARRGRRRAAHAGMVADPRRAGARLHAAGAAASRAAPLAGAGPGRGAMGAARGVHHRVGRGVRACPPPGRAGVAVMADAGGPPRERADHRRGVERPAPAADDAQAGAEGTSSGGARAPRTPSGPDPADARRRNLGVRRGPARTTAAPSPPEPFHRPSRTGRGRAAAACPESNPFRESENHPCLFVRACALSPYPPPWRWP